MKDIIQKIKENTLLIDILIILILTIIIEIPLYNKNFNVYYGDGAQNIVRAYETYKTIRQNKTSVIISDFINGFGYSWGLFNGPLSAFFIIVFSLFKLSFVSGLKALFFLACFFSGFSIYKLMYDITEKRKVALISCIFYITSPYFLNLMFVRHAVEEIIAYALIPVYFYGLYGIVNSKENEPYYIIGAIRINFNK